MTSKTHRDAVKSEEILKVQFLLLLETNQTKLENRAYYMTKKKVGRIGFAKNRSVDKCEGNLHVNYIFFS